MSQCCNHLVVSAVIAAIMVDVYAQAIDANFTVTPQLLVAELASGDFETRERAHRALLALGPAAEPALRSILETDDVEQRLRAESILRQLNRGKLWQPSEITIKAENEPVLDVYRQVAEQTGNAINWDRTPKTIDGLITVDWRNKTYWQALDELGRMANVNAQMFDDPNRSGIKLVSGTPAKNPVAYQGPLRLSLVSSRHSLSETFNFADTTADRQQFLNLTFALHWEQRLQLCRYNGRPRIVEAITDTGEDLHVKSRATIGMMQVTRRQRQLVLSTRLNPPSRSTAALNKLVVAIDLVSAGTFETLAIKDLTKPGQVQNFGYKLGVTPLIRNGAICQMTVEWRRPYPFDKMNRTDMIDEYLEVVDDDGKLLTFNQAQVIGDKLSVKYVIQVQAKRGKPAGIRFNVALLKGERSFEFVFNDVPLPVLSNGK